MASYRAPTAASLPTGGTLFLDPDAGGTVREAKSSGGSLRQVSVDNTGNTIKCFLKLYDALAASVTLGTTVPTVVLRVLPSRSLRVAIPNGMTFGTGISYAVVTDGGTGGTISPPNEVTTRLTFTD